MVPHIAALHPLSVIRLDAGAFQETCADPDTSLRRNCAKPDSRAPFGPTSPPQQRGVTNSVTTSARRRQTEDAAGR
jgi:hypothetical protein